MADSAVAITAGTGTNIDTRTESTNGNHRQVIIIGDPATNAGVAPVDATAGLKVNLGADNDVTVTGTVDLGATDNAVLDAIQTAAEAIQAGQLADGHNVTVDNASIAVTNADITTIAGDTTSIDGKLPALGQALADASIPVILPSATITTLTPQTDALTDTELRATPVPVSGTVTANLSATDNAVLDTIAAKDFATQTTLAAIDGHVDGIETLIGTTNSTLGTIDVDTSNISTKIDTIAGAVSGTEMQVDVLTMPTVAVTGTFYQATQPVSLASVPSHEVTNAGTFATQATLQTGSNTIGKLAANSGVDIGDVDVTSLPALAAGTAEIGSLLPPDTDVTAHTNYVRKYYTSAGAATDGVVWSPAAGKRWHITSLYFQTSADATITFEDDKAGGDDPVFKGEFKAGSGIQLTFTEQYPLASGEDAADLLVTTSGGNIYVTCVGYEI